MRCYKWHARATRALEPETEQRIAIDLGISRNTVHTHIKRLYSRVDVHDRAELLHRAYEAYDRLREAGDPGPASE